MANESPSKRSRRIPESGDLDLGTQKALEDIDRIQTELDVIEEKASAECLSIERKYNTLRKPLTDRRNEIISSIPNFWLTAIMNHPDLSSLVDVEEEDCLQYLTKIEVIKFEDIISGHYIKFYFKENPYFENGVLTKEYHFGNDNTASSKSTEIIWKQGHQLGQAGPSSDATPPMCGGKRRLITRKSFFNWFQDNIDPFTDDTAEDIKEDLWVNPLLYYLVADGQEEDQNSGQRDEDVTSSDDNEDSAVTEVDSALGSVINGSAQQ